MGSSAAVSMLKTRSSLLSAWQSAAGAMVAMQRCGAVDVKAGVQVRAVVQAVFVYLSR